MTTLTPARVVTFGLALSVCLTLHHPLLAVLPQLAECMNSDEVAAVLVDNYEAVERFYLAASA